MLSRITYPITFVQNQVIGLIKEVMSILRYQLDSQYKNLESNSEDNPNGMAQTGFLGYHVVMIRPKMNSEKTEALVKQIMYLEGEEARTNYNFFPALINGEFFLNMNNKKGLELRKKIIPYLNPSKLKENYAYSISELFAKMHESKHENSEKIKEYLLDTFMQSLAGLNLTDEMRSTLLKIGDVHHTGPLLVAYLYFPRRILRLFSSIKNFENESEKIIKTFLYQQIDELRKHKVLDKGNWISDVIAEKCRGKDLEKLTDKEINQLASDSDIRMCLGLVLGVMNLSQALWIGLVELYKDEMRFFFENIKKEIEANSKDQDAYTSKEKMPLLHAFYLESLRFMTHGILIPRYTKKAISTPEFTIPSHSFILLSLDSAYRKVANKKYPSDGFYPQRFLNENGKLNDYAQLNHGLFTPFGVGKRMCPGTRLTEDVFKYLMVEFIKHVKYVNQNNFEFINIMEEPIYIKERYVKPEFFQRIKENQHPIENDENAVEKISKIIMRYAF